MKILLIYRNKEMGFSIGKVFKPIEQELRNFCDVDSIELPCANYSIRSLIMNIKFAKEIIRKEHYDLVHITGAEYYLIPFLKGCKTMVTVHDLGFYANKKKSFKQIFKYLLWIRTLPLASFTTFISNKSKKEAENYVRFKESRVAVVYDPIGDDYIYHPKNIDVSYPRILHIGTNPHKNLSRSLEALKNIRCKLVIVGKLNETYRDLLIKNHIQYENKCNLTDNEILKEYIECDIVNFPSLHEGFGMPIIEGQSIGRPVLTSNVSPMKEIAGEGAILVNPESVEDIRQGYKKIFQHSEVLVDKGLDNVKRFRLNIIVQQYLDIYKKIITR